MTKKKGTVKIIAIGMIKNAADVIETCVRGNSWLIDQFVFLDNMSTDRTIEILNLLREEGFNIEIISDTEIQYTQSEKMEKLCAYVYKKYSCDFVIPIDDDEIIVPENGSISITEIKDIFYTLSHEAIYYVPWRNYFPTEYDNNVEMNVAKRQTYCFLDDTVKTYHKIIIPEKVISEDGFHIMMGNHDATYSKKHDEIVFPELRFAHFPIRSEEQIKSKALIGYTNLLAMPDRNKDHGAHWGIIYQQILDGKPLTTELLQSLSTLYLHPDMEPEYENNPVNLPNEYLQLKYTHKNEVNALKNYCLNVETLAVKYAELLKQTMRRKTD